MTLLTKDYLIAESGGMLSPKVMNQILKNQEDAEKYSERRCDICGHTLSHCCCSNEKRKAVRENIQIVECLKKRIEENVWNDCDCEYGGCRHSFASELQKILKGYSVGE